jgi:RNA 2',3'-cyclic 3'-phosphodiesterase
VAKERLKSPRARLFVALDLPDRVREGLAEWQRTSLSDIEALRPLAPPQLHVTLCFLAYHPERDIERIAALVTGVRARPVEIRFDADPVPVPRNRPRLFAVGGDSPTAAELQQELSDLPEGRGFYRPEKRPFWTHVTVARVRSERGASRGRGRRRRGAPMGVTESPRPLPAALTEPFGAVRVALYRSTLRPTGAEYSSLAELDLPPMAERGDEEDG